MTGVSTAAARHCADYAEANFKRLADEWFPDNSHNSWAIDGFEVREDLTLVAATPTPDDVGYPAFKFAFHYDPATDTVTCVAVYCLEASGYSLLCSDRGWTRRVPRAVP